ncbi:MAG: hypothetical protein HOP29_13370 [Phycisphaerales bacterium]|nr:hypothetical protein [Phycisphaerales bacterium]
MPDALSPCTANLNRSPAAARRPGRLPVTIAILAITAAHVVGRVGSFCAPTHADSFLYAAIGYRMAHGEPLYGPTLSDVKPPGIYAFYALSYALLPPGRSSIIPVDTLFAALGYWTVYRLGRIVYGSAVSVIVTATFAIVVNAFMVLDFATEAFGLAESFMIFPAALAASVYFAAVARPLYRNCVAIGCALGACLAVKQTAVALVGAIALHLTFTAIVDRWPFRRCVATLAGVGVGALFATLPFLVLVMAQGTWRSAIAAIGPQALRLLSAESAWPTDWGEIQPLWVPLGWCAIGLFAWREHSSRAPRPDRARPVSPRTALDTPCDDSPRHGRSAIRAIHVGFLLTWLAAEVALLAFLPLRSAHYYIPLCIPLLILSGMFWKGLSAVPLIIRGPAFAVAAVVSIAFLRPVFNRIIPIAVSRYRAYEPTADRAHFDALVRQPFLVLGPTMSRSAPTEWPAKPQ